MREQCNALPERASPHYRRLDPRTEPWRKDARRCHWRSTDALALIFSASCGGSTTLPATATIDSATAPIAGTYRLSTVQGVAMPAA
jgi:hypothetical protein